MDPKDILLLYLQSNFTPEDVYSIKDEIFLRYSHNQNTISKKIEVRVNEKFIQLLLTRIGDEDIKINYRFFKSPESEYEYFDFQDFLKRIWDFKFS